MSFKLKINSLLTILNIEDVDGNGYYDVNDFLEMNNKEILDMNNGKKFDICLMNPPYKGGSLELKFLEQAIKISDNVVSIQPIAWLQDPKNYENEKSKFNKYNNTIVNYINDVEYIENASQQFGIGANVDIGIYICNKNGGYDVKSLAWQKINKKDFDLFNDSAKHFPKLEIYDENKNETKAFVNIKTFANQGRTTRYNIVAPNTYKVIYKGKLPNGDIWNSKKYKSKSLAKDKPFGIYFDTYKEAINFYNSCLTECYKYIVSVFKHQGGVPLGYLPFMDDYTEPWTNERFFKYYKISKDKQKEIIESMKPYMNNDDLIK